MSTETLEPVQTVMQKLADLTNRLPDDQGSVISMMVDRALADEGSPAAGDDDGAAPPEAAVEAAVAELFALRESLPADEQEIVDAMVQKAAGHEPEVAGHWWQHRFTVQVPGFGTAQNFYRNSCNANQRSANPRYSIGYFDMSFGRVTTTYTCWAWIGA